MSALSWAIALSVLSAVGYAAAAVAQEHYAGTVRGVRGWAVPLLLTGSGAGLHVVALRYGAVGVVQALGSLTLIFALPIAAVRARTRVAGSAWHHAWLTAGGLAALLTLVSGGTGLLSVPSALSLAGAAAVLITVLVATAKQAPPMARSLLLSSAAGVSFGIASVLTKTVLTGSWTGAGLLTAAAVAGLATAGQVLSQHSYQDAGLAAPLAVASVVNPAVAGAIGLLLLGDGIRFGALGSALAVSAAIVAARGVIGLAAHSATDATTAAQDTSAVPGRGAPITVHAHRGPAPAHRATRPRPARTEALAHLPA
ncbi:MAG: hypothetical protein QOJ50_419 [Cryptosporangiaceae bacterium]|nr:hypothetical protein [Cryptosporangiaceae bacterium]